MPSYKNQNYSSIKKDCIKKGILFDDPEFPANNKSLFYSKVDNDVVWKRPKEICKVPRLIVEGVSCDDLNAGDAGNSWYITACASIAQEPKLWQKIVPNWKDQEWSEKNPYAGIFQFSFWRFGDWIDVVIDDRLPTKDGKLILCHSKTRNEFWSALLEKAYAKLYGDYESLSNAQVSDALVDFTGGVAQKFYLKQMDTKDSIDQQALFGKLVEASENRSLINCIIECPPEQRGEPLEEGLLQGNGYNITSIKQIPVSKGMQGAVGGSMLYMVRLNNPWGKAEWTGAWSDGSPEMKKLSPSEREKLGIKFQHEGEFWMNFSDFLNNFTKIDVCHFVNTSMFSLKKTWSEAMLHSKWGAGGRNGGSEFHSATFLSNPQFVFDMTAPGVAMASLEQNDVRPGQQFGQSLLTIGFSIWKVEENRRYRIHMMDEKIVTSDYVPSRSVFLSLTLNRGRYVLIPTTQDPGENGQFMLRLYTSNSSAAKELNEDAPTASCCGKPPVLATTITVLKAEGLELTEKEKAKNQTMDPLIIIRCEGESVKSQHVKNTSTPTYNIKATFYRKKPDLPITVEIMNRNTLIDDFVAEARVDETGKEEGNDISCTLYGRKKEKDVEKPGKLDVHIMSSHDLTYV